MLVDLLSTKKMKVANNGKRSTMKGAYNAIDLIIVSDEMNVDWSDVVPSTNSDHEMVIAYIAMKPKRSEDRIRIYRNWSLDCKESRIQLQRLQWTGKDEIIKRCRSILSFPESNSFLLRRGTMRYRADASGLFIQNVKKAIKSEDLWFLLRKFVFFSKPRVDYSCETTRRSKQDHLAKFSEEVPSYLDIPSNLSGSLSQLEVTKLSNMKRWSSSLSADNFSIKTWTRFYELNRDSEHSMFDVQTLTCTTNSGHSGKCFRDEEGHDVASGHELELPG